MSLTLSPAQIRSIANATGRVNLWEGSIRSGKTFGSVIKFCEAIIEKAGAGVIVITGRNRDSIYRNFFEPIFTVPELGWLADAVSYRQGSPTAKIFNQVVHVIGANDRDSETKLRGVTVAVAYVDEATVIPDNFFKQLLGRMSVPNAQMFATTNPDSPMHWLKKEYLDRLQDLKDWRVFHFTLDDNPTLSEEYKASIKAEYTGLWYRRFIQGEWVSAEGAIYDMWDEHQHVIPWDELPPIREVLATGIDYGTTNATSAITLGITVDGRLALLDEWRLDAGNRGLTPWTDAQQSQAIAKYLGQQHAPGNAQRPRFVYTDPAAASFKTQLYQDGVHNLHNADNHVVDGIRQVASLLEQGKLIVSSKCTGFIQEVPGYAWDSKATANGEDKPIKLNDHSLDAARYVIYSTRHLWRHQLNKT